MTRKVGITALVPHANWISSNQRLHWASKASRTEWIRSHFASLASGFRPFDRPVHVTAYIGYPTSGRADPANAYPSVKAAVDGLVDAGLLPDDSHEWVIGPDMRRDHVKAPKGSHTLRLEVQGVE